MCTVSGFNSLPTLERDLASWQSCLHSAPPLYPPTLWPVTGAWCHHTGARAEQDTARTQADEWHLQCNLHTCSSI